MRRQTAWQIGTDVFDEPDISIRTAGELTISNPEDVHIDPHHVIVCISADALLWPLSWHRLFSQVLGGFLQSLQTNSLILI